MDTPSGMSDDHGSRLKTARAACFFFRVSAGCTCCALGLAPHSRRAGSRFRAHPATTQAAAQTVQCSSAPFAMASSASEKTRSRLRFPFWAEGGLSRLRCSSAGLKAPAAAAKREPRLTGTCGRGRPRNNSFANPLGALTEQLRPRRGRFVGASRQQVLGPSTKTSQIREAFEENHQRSPKVNVINPQAI